MKEKASIYSRLWLRHRPAIEWSLKKTAFWIAEQWVAHLYHICMPKARGSLQKREQKDKSNDSMERSGKHYSSYVPKELVSNVSRWRGENWFSLIMLLLLIVLRSSARSHILEYTGGQHKLELMNGGKRHTFGRRRNHGLVWEKLGESKWVQWKQNVHNS